MPPLVFLQYGVVFTSGNLNEYQNVMFRFLIAFILLDRHHYNRSTLSMLNDLYHQKQHFRDYYNFKMKWFSLITATAFFNASVRPYNRGTNSERNLKWVAGKTAEVLLKVVQLAYWSKSWKI